jgi:hypothetical protein
MLRKSLHQQRRGADLCECQLQQQHFIIKGANKFLSPEDIDRAAEDLKNAS